MIFQLDCANNLATVADKQIRMNALAMIEHQLGLDEKISPDPITFELLHQACSEMYLKGALRIYQLLRIDFVHGGNPRIPEVAS